MKTYLFAFLFIFSGTQLWTQPQWELLTERPNEKTLKGFLNSSVLKSDSSFTWYGENYKAYTPHKEGLAALQSYKDSVHLLVFMGTWCEDSHFIIPRLYALAHAANFAEHRITLMGADRKKETWGGLMELLSVKNVPTIIVYKNGKEAGRIVEYGKYGQFDKELGEIIRTSFSH